MIAHIGSRILKKRYLQTLKIFHPVFAIDKLAWCIEVTYKCHEILHIQEENLEDKSEVPSVTVCNLNPFKLSAIDKDSVIYDVVKFSIEVNSIVLSSKSHCQLREIG